MRAVPGAEGRRLSAPGVISPEAAALIAALEARNDRPAVPLPDDLNGWDDLFARQEQAAAPANARALERYRPALRTERVAGLDVEVVTPTNIGATRDRIVYLHGGGYTMFSARSTLFASVPLANDLGLELWSIDYPRAPRSTFDRTVPAVADALQQIIAMPGRVLLVGDSAGGGLAVAATLASRARGVQPAALALWSPWCDVNDGDVSHRWLAAADPVLTYRDNLERGALAYAPADWHRDPAVSPAYGEFDAEFPPVLIQCGTREILLSGCVRLYRRLEAAGAIVVLDLYEGMYHSFPAVTPDVPEASLARRKVSAFFAQQR